MEVLGITTFFQSLFSFSLDEKSPSTFKEMKTANVAVKAWFLIEL